MIFDMKFFGLSILSVLYMGESKAKKHKKGQII